MQQQKWRRSCSAARSRICRACAIYLCMQLRRPSTPTQQVGASVTIMRMIYVGYIYRLSVCLSAVGLRVPVTTVGWLSDPWVNGVLLAEVLAALLVEHRAMIKQVGVNAVHV